MRLKIAFINVLSIALAIASRSAAAQAEHASNALLDSLVGHWRMTGQVRGHPVAYDLDVRRILNGAFIQLHMKDVARPAQYEALVLIGEDTVSNGVLVHWLDSTGGANSVPSGEGSTAGDTLTFDIPYPGHPFRDTFVHRRSDGSWTFHLDARDARGGSKVFASYEVHRVRAAH